MKDTYLMFQETFSALASRIRRAYLFGKLRESCLASCESPVWQAARVAGSKAVAQERGGPLPSMDVADALLVVCPIID
jgi:hypothetical protein